MVGSRAFFVLTVWYHRTLLVSFKSSTGEEDMLEFRKQPTTFLALGWSPSVQLLLALKGLGFL